MDVFKIDQSLTGSHLGNAPPPEKLSPEVTFDSGGSEFNLSFFSGEDNSSTQGGFSDPGSVGSVASASSPPPQIQSFPGHLQAGGSASVGSVLLQSPQGIKQEQHYAAADSNSSTPTKSFVPCKVCGDKASGYHYGVTSCEGCKGFFRRSIQKQIEYRCLRDGKCLVIRLNRNRCQYCRFKKCLAVGMSRDSVRYGRVPKRSRERGMDDTTRVTTTDPDQSDIESKQLAMYDIIVMVSQAHQANCGYTEEHTRTINEKNLIVIPPAPAEEQGVATSTADALEFQRIWLWQQFAIRITPSVQRVVEFAKRIPGFCDLSQDDQLILIKIGFFEVWLTHIARYTSDTAMMFDDGTKFGKEHMEIMYDAEFVTSFFNFTSSFNSYTLTDGEVGLFSAVVLLTADRPGVTDPKAVEHNQDRIIEALKIQIGRNHVNEPQLFSSLLVKLPELRNLGTKHSGHLDWFRVNWKKMKLPPLFAEIFDIPKCEDDLQ